MEYAVYVILIVGAVIVFHAMLPPQKKSPFELIRLAKTGDAAALRQKALIEWNKSVHWWIVLQQLIVSILLVFYGIFLWGAVVGCLAAVAVWAVVPVCGRMLAVRKVGYWWYEKNSYMLQAAGEKLPLAIRRSLYYPATTTQKIFSKEELASVISASEHVLNDGERRRILHGLSLDQRTVRHIMRPWDNGGTIADSEVLGPLVLDYLHDLKQPVVWVTDGATETVIGFLRIKENLTVSRRPTMRVRDVMVRDIEVISEDMALFDAVKIMRDMQEEVLVVIDTANKPVGTLQLYDVIDWLV